jgi:hypothetical protein
MNERIRIISNEEIILTKKNIWCLEQIECSNELTVLEFKMEINKIKEEVNKRMRLDE